jgi:hypothetical protein
MNTNSYLHLTWIVGAAILGFALSAVFAGLLQFQRNLFLVPYLLLAGLFIASYARWSQLNLGELVRHNWPWGLVGALALGVFVVRNILSQPVSPHATGLQLAFDLFWQGIVYGGLDGLFLSVLPVLVTWNAFSQLGWLESWPGKLAVGVLALFASLFVTFAYHWGFPEYRGSQVAAPLFGNGMMSLGYLLSNNPVAAFFSHIAMHLAGVLHGPATVMQLPPHY